MSVRRKRIWRLEGFDGALKIFETTIPAYLISETQMREVLKRLASRRLSESEIIGASLNRTGKRNSLLEIISNTQPTTSMSCGTNPHYVAKMLYCSNV
jgi:hypothetical protein